MAAEEKQIYCSFCCFLRCSFKTILIYWEKDLSSCSAKFRMASMISESKDEADMALKMDFLNTKKEPTEMERVTENIAQVEGEIQQKVYQLGQLYYEEHKADEAADSQYYRLVDAISKLELNRMGFYKNKLRLQGQMMCENCGAVIPYGSVFCSACGKRADEKQEGGAVPDGMTPGKSCTACGAALEEDSLFCASCGTKVE